MKREQANSPHPRWSSRHCYYELYWLVCQMSPSAVPSKHDDGLQYGVWLEPRTRSTKHDVRPRKNRGEKATTIGGAGRVRWCHMYRVTLRHVQRMGCSSSITRRAKSSSANETLNAKRANDVRSLSHAASFLPLPLVAVAVQPSYGTSRKKRRSQRNVLSLRHMKCGVKKVPVRVAFSNLGSKALQ